MGHSITVNADHTEVNGVVYNSGDTLVVSDDYFAGMPSGDFSGGSPLLTDNGEVADPGTGDAVFVSTAAPALTSADAAANPPTQAEFNALRADVVALRTALTGAAGSGKPLHT